MISGCCSASTAVYNTEGWVGHPLDPIGCLFDTLAEASLVPDDHMPRLPTYFGENLTCLHLKFYLILESAFNLIPSLIV